MGSHCPLSELPYLYTWMSRTYEPLTAVLLFPALLPVNSNDPASLSLSDIDCFYTFSGFWPQTFFLDFASRTFLLSQNRQKYSLRSTCWWQFFVGHWLYLRLAQRIMVPPAADILIFNLCSVTTFICYFWPFGIIMNKIKIKHHSVVLIYKFYFIPYQMVKNSNQNGKPHFKT